MISYNNQVVDIHRFYLLGEAGGKLPPQAAQLSPLKVCHADKIINPKTVHDYASKD